MKTESYQPIDHMDAQSKSRPQRGAILPSLGAALAALLLLCGNSATHPMPALEAADQVDGPFVPLAVSPFETGGVAAVALPITRGQRFFRLRMP